MWCQFQTLTKDELPLVHSCTFSKEDIEFVFGSNSNNTWNVTDGKHRVYIYNSTHPQVHFMKGNTPDAVEIFMEYMHICFQKRKIKNNNMLCVL